MQKNIKQYCFQFSLKLPHLRWTLVTLLWVIAAPICAQKIDAQVFNGFGASQVNGNRNYDISVGEMAVSTITANGYYITQGFLQPIDLKLPCGDVELIAFPNPVVEEMTIYAEGCDIEVEKVKTYDLFGKMVYEGHTLNNKINFSSIGVGVYLVRTFNKDEQELGVVKILKTTI